MQEIPAQFLDLLADETRAFAFLGTVMGDGSPQVTPVWFNFKDGFLFINTARGRVKDRNIGRRRKIAVAIPDPKDPYRYLQIRGTVVEITEDGAEAHIHALSQKYRGKPYDLPAGQVRVMYRIEPENVSSMG